MKMVVWTCTRDSEAGELLHHDQRHRCCGKRSRTVEERVFKVSPLARKKGMYKVSCEYI